MQSHLKKIGARIYLYEKMRWFKRSHMFTKTGRRASLCPDSSISVCLQTPSCSERKCQIRFFVYPFSATLYDTDVNSLKFFNGSDRTVNISCFGREIILSPGESGKLVNNGKKVQAQQ